LPSFLPSYVALEEILASQHTEQPQNPAELFNQTLEKLPGFTVPLALLTLGVFIWLFYKPKRQKSGRARMATDQELLNSFKAAAKNINNPREVTLWVGMPRYYGEFKGKGGKTQKVIFPHKDTFFFPRANEHLGCLAASGGGKTRYFMNRIGTAAIQQGLPIMAIDMKGHEERWCRGTGDPSDRDQIAPTSELGGIALMHGYEVFDVDPFGRYSHRINPIHNLENAQDAMGADSFSGTLMLNCQEANERKDFYYKAGSRVLQGPLMLCRGLKNGGDLATLHKILERLSAKPDSVLQSGMTEYQKAPWSQFLAAIKSGETGPNIVTTALDASLRFVRPEFTAVFCRDTNIPLVLKRKQMVIFRVHPKYKKSLIPIVAANFEMMLKANIYDGGVGGVAILDEIPQYKLMTIHEDMGVARSKRWCVAWAAQGEAMMESNYGKDLVKAIREVTGTLWTGKQSHDHDGNKKLADSFGQETVDSRNKSFSTKGTTTAEAPVTRPLVPHEELKQMLVGQAFVESPGISGYVDRDKGKKEKRVSLPIKHQFIIPRHEQQMMKKAEKRWLAHRKKQARNPDLRIIPLTNEQLSARGLLAEKLLPDPPFPFKAQKEGNPSKSEKELQQGDTKSDLLDPSALWAIVTSNAGGEFDVDF
jgi:hypothetical protein